MVICLLSGEVLAAPGFVDKGDFLSAVTTPVGEDADGTVLPICHPQLCDNTK